MFVSVFGETKMCCPLLFDVPIYGKGVLFTLLSDQILECVKPQHNSQGIHLTLLIHTCIIHTYTCMHIHHTFTFMLARDRINLFWYNFLATRLITIIFLICLVLTFVSTILNYRGRNGHNACGTSGCTHDLPSLIFTFLHLNMHDLVMLCNSNFL